MKMSVDIEEWELTQPLRISNFEWVNARGIVVQLAEDGHVGRGEAQGVFYLDEDADSLFAQVHAVARGDPQGYFPRRPAAPAAAGRRAQRVGLRAVGPRVQESRQDHLAADRHRAETGHDRVHDRAGSHARGDGRQGSSGGRRAGAEDQAERRPALRAAGRDPRRPAGRRAGSRRQPGLGLRPAAGGDTELRHARSRHDRAAPAARRRRGAGGLRLADHAGRRRILPAQRRTRRRRQALRHDQHQAGQDRRPDRGAEARPRSEGARLQADGGQHGRHLAGHAVIGSSRRSVRRLVGIGVPVPSPVDPHHQDRVSELGLPAWQGHHGLEPLGDRHKVPLWIDNDANLGALAEGWWGAGRGVQDFAYIKLATGIGSGHVIHGKIYRGATGVAGEIGHLAIDPHGGPCICGLRGCLATFVGQAALLARAREILANGTTSTLPAQEITIPALEDAALAGDPLALQVVREAAEYLGIAVAGLLNLMNPALVILGGDVEPLGELLLQPLRETIGRRTLVSSIAAAEVRTSALNAQAGAAS